MSVPRDVGRAEPLAHDALKKSCSMTAHGCFVRFASESGHTRLVSPCRLRANRVITHCSKRHRLFDHQIVPRHGCASYRLGGRCRDPCLRPPHLMSAQQIKISRNSGWPTIRKTTLKKRRLASPNTVRQAALKPEAPEGREPCQHIFYFGLSHLI